MMERERRLQEARERGDPFFLGLPESWYEAGKYRCENGHISTTLLKSEGLGRSACLACRAPVKLTFPEDQEDAIPRDVMRQGLEEYGFGMQSWREG